MDGEELWDRLQLHHQLTAHQQVQLRCPHGTRAVADGHRYLPAKGNVPVGQLQTESLLVDRFEETRTKGAMHFNCSTYRLVDECVQLGARLFGGRHPKSSSDAKGWLREFIAQEFVPPRSPERGMMSFRPRPGSGLPGRVVRPLTNALVKVIER